MDILTDNMVRATFNFGEIHSLSMDLLSFMEENEVMVGEGAVAAMLTAGRLIAGRDMTPDEEVKWLQDALQWSGVYLLHGGTH